MKRRTAIIAVLVGCGTNASTPDAMQTCEEDCASVGQLCEIDRCVDPWTYGSPQWSRCENEPRATPETLAQKAAIYDARALALHAHPQMPWVVDVVLKPGVDPETATASDVAYWWSGENDGLFSGLVLAAEAYRWGVTRDPAARAAVLRLLEGEEMRMRITGVPGLFTRQVIPPGIEGLACPTDPALYTPSPDKRGNKWVKIGGDGCAQVVDQGTTTFRSTSHCGLGEFRDWCFLDNISQDEYIGHFLALDAVARAAAVQQPFDNDISSRTAEMRRQMFEHLLQHDMAFVDWDGRVTQWGKLYPGAPGDTRGYLAVLGVAALTTGQGVGYPGFPPYYEPARQWHVELDAIDQWSGPDGCEANWNNLSMLTASFHLLLSRTQPYDIADPYRTAFVNSLGAPAETNRGITVQKNAWWNIMWAAQKPLGLGTDGPAFDAVEDAVCQLRQFPRSNHTVAKDTTALAPGVCLDRQDNSLAQAPFDVADRCAATFAYWGNPYERSMCTEWRDLVRQPGAYLLAYWMGRYYGFIPADL